jgi:transposase-like protein
MTRQKSATKTKQQLADEYGVCSKTFNKWLNKHKVEVDRGLITPKEQEIIYSILGVPKNSQEF